jgi:hypothetical protein
VTPEEHARARELSGRRRRRRRTARNRLLLAIALLVAFGVGVALGQALHDNPRPGEQTFLRTLPPLTKSPEP